MKTIVQFGYKDVVESSLAGYPVVDCRVIRNPFVRNVPDEVLIERVRKAVGFEDVVKLGVQLIASNDRIYVGCLYGKHRSGAVAQEIAARTGARIVKLKEE